MGKKSKKKDTKRILKDVWYFIWEDDSIWSWIVNIILAFVLIKYVVYPGLGFLLATSHPIVAVVSGSMHHDGNFDNWWENGNEWYVNNDITKEDFLYFSFRNGFSRGDIMVLSGAKPKDIKIGDIIVFISHKNRPRADPIIHRVVVKMESDGKYSFQTKGDNHNTNKISINACDSTGCIDETDISEEQIIGKALFRVPFLGYVKIWAVEMVCLVDDFNFCIRS
jgi:signal peptidase I